MDAREYVRLMSGYLLGSIDHNSLDRLRQKLPFEDDEFDHVHIQGMAFAVPEHKVLPPHFPHAIRD